MTATVELESSDGKIDPENRTCTLLSGTKVACLTLQGCLLYEGEAVTEELGQTFEHQCGVGYVPCDQIWRNFAYLA